MSVPEETAASRYVKLDKAHDQGIEEIRPGELNQPVFVPELVVHRCNECGQPLPDTFEPPGTEPWSSGIFGCREDMDSCKTGFFCPCVQFGRNVENLKEDIPWTTPCICHAIFVEGGLVLGAATVALHGINPKAVFLVGEGLLFAWWMCGIYTGLFRQELQRKYHLENSPGDPCLVHCCFHWCALCQEHREMQVHLSDNMVMPMTMINPPPHQQMDAQESATVIHKEDAEVQEP